MNQEPEKFLTVREVAEKTNTPYHTVRRWVDEKRIEAVRVGPASSKLKRVRIRASVVREMFPGICL